MNESACDLLLRGGRVIDPASGVNADADVAIRDGRILAVGHLTDMAAKTVLDVTGCMVVPGLIDMHCHCFPTFPFSDQTLPTIHPDAHMLQNGVTTCVDAGTCGWQNFPQFYETVIKKARVRVLAFLNIADRGMACMADEDDPARLRPGVAAEVAKAYGDAIVGIKTAHYWVGKPFDALHAPWASVDAALEAAQRSGLPCMADVQPTLPERSYPALLERLRPGDIHTHVYAQQFPVLDAQGRVSDFLLEARARGVAFDLGHGAGSFWFRNAVPALRQGFPPDTLSTDLYLDNVAGPVIGLMHVMSKYLCMGMPVPEIIRRVTAAPAALIRRPELGTLAPGACADVAVLRIVEQPVHFADSGRARMAGDRFFQCMAALRGGQIAYDPYALSLHDWESAPAPYWTPPGVLP